MSLTALPSQGNILVPIDWQGETQKTTMQAAGYMLSGTFGWRPYTEKATITWVLDPTSANTVLDAFKATNFNGVYTYDCNVRGTIKVRLTGVYSLVEKRAGQMVVLGVEVTTV